MAAKNKPAGIRSLVYGMGKGKARIEGLSVSKKGLEQPQGKCLLGSFLTIAHGQGLIDAHGLVSHR